MNGKVSSHAQEVAIAYIHGRIEAQIEAFSYSLGLPAPELAARVAALLLTKTGGESMGATDRVSTVRRKAAQKRTSTRKVALVSGTRSGTSKIKEYWMRMTPEQRKKEVAKRMAKRKAA